MSAVVLKKSERMVHELVEVIVVFDREQNQYCLKHKLGGGEVVIQVTDQNLKVVSDDDVVRQAEPEVLAEPVGSA